MPVAPVPRAIDWPGELQRHDRWLRTAVWLRLRDGHAVDEVMQEVALAAIRQSAPLQDATKVGPWLYRVAIRQALLHRRRCGRWRRLREQVAVEAPAAAVGDHDPLGWLLAEERQTLVRRALAELETRDAEILLLKYSENWSYHEIAAHLGVSHSAVETRLHRARSRLRERLTSLQLVGTREPGA